MPVNPVPPRRKVTDAPCVMLREEAELLKMVTVPPVEKAVLVSTAIDADAVRIRRSPTSELSNVVVLVPNGSVV